MLLIYMITLMTVGQCPLTYVMTRRDIYHLERELGVALA